MLLHLGCKVPCIGSLRLEVHGGILEQGKFRSGFAIVLRRFPNLKTLVLMSRPPPSDAYIHESHSQTAPRMQIKPFEPPQIAEQHLLDLPPWSDGLVYDTESPYIPDTLHDSSAHLGFLSRWHHAQPSLERVVFPTGAYTYIAKEEGVTNEGGVRMSVSFRPRRDQQLFSLVLDR